MLIDEKKECQQLDQLKERIRIIKGEEKLAGRIQEEDAEDGGCYLEISKGKKKRRRRKGEGKKKEKKKKKKNCGGLLFFFLEGGKKKNTSFFKIFLFGPRFVVQRMVETAIDYWRRTRLSQI